MRLKPRHAEALYYLGMTQRQLGELAPAARSLRRAAAEAPGLAQAHLQLGVTLQETGDLKGAIDSLRRAVQLDPQLLDAKNSLGLALSLDGLGKNPTLLRRGRQRSGAT